jgi:hypothetical protein
VIAVLSLVTCGLAWQANDGLFVQKEWAERFQRMPVVDCTIEGQVITTSDFVEGLAVQVIPDEPLPLKVHCRIDFVAARAWVLRDEYEWHVQRQRFQHKLTEATVISGATRLHYMYPDTGEESETNSHDTADTWLIRQIDISPIWMNSGIVDVGLRGASVFALPQYREDRGVTWTLVPDDPDRSGGRQQWNVGSVGRASQFNVLVDTQNGHSILSWQMVRAGRVLCVIELSYGDVDHSRIADKWSVSVFSSKRRMEKHAEMKVTEFQRHADFKN